MKRLKMNGPGLFFMSVFVFCMLFLFTSCGQGGSTSSTGSSSSGGDTSSTTQSAGDPYALYNKVQGGQTKEQVDAALGVKSEELTTDNYIYTDADGYGVAVGFSDIMSETNTPVVITKMIYGTKSAWYMNSIGRKNEITDEQAAKITEGMTYDQVKSILGSDGIENSTSYSYDGSLNITRLWLKDGIISGLGLIFNGAGGAGTVVQIVTI
jgi:hypothetical protein